MCTSSLRKSVREKIAGATRTVKVRVLDCFRAHSRNHKVRAKNNKINPLAFRSSSGALATQFCLLTCAVFGLLRTLRGPTNKIQPFCSISQSGRRQKTTPNTLARRTIRTKVYIATASWCGHCKTLKEAIFMGMTKNGLHSSVDELLQKKNNTKNPEELSSLRTEFSNLLMQNGTLKLYEDNENMVVLLETGNRQNKEIVELIKPEAYPTYYAVKNSEVKSLEVKTLRDYFQWLNDILQTAQQA